MAITSKKDVNLLLVLVMLSILSVFFGYVVIKYVLEPLFEKVNLNGVKEWLQLF